MSMEKRRKRVRKGRKRAKEEKMNMKGTRKKEKKGEKKRRRSWMEKEGKNDRKRNVQDVQVRVKGQGAGRRCGQVRMLLAPQQLGAASTTAE